MGSVKTKKKEKSEKFVKSKCVKNLLKMTTAARPTFDTARGGSGQRERDLSALSKQYSSRDLPSHTSLKYRERGQGAPEENLGRDFRRELEDREREASRENTDRKIRGSD